MSAKRIHVAVGVITDPEGKILIAKRPDHVHQGGLWEFPGGKVEPGENVEVALARELREELAVQILNTQPVIEVVHDYTDKQVFLDVHRVTAWQGDPVGNEGQAIRWVGADELSNFTFPAANYPIVRALQLPSHYLVTGQFDSSGDCIERLESALHNHAITLVQLRAPWLLEAALRELVAKLRPVCAAHRVRLIVNHPLSIELYAELGVDGIHLTAHQAASLIQRPDCSWLGVSCHSADEIETAQRINADFITLSPVNPTLSHPQASHIGWDEFARLTARATLPVYALGGMKPNDLDQALRAGAQGTAAIRAWWPQ